MSEPNRRSLGRELSSVFRVVVVATALMVVAVGALLGYSVGVSGPQQTSAERTLTSLQLLQREFLAQQSDVRAYLVTGASDDRIAYATSRTQARDAMAQLASSASGDLRGDVQALVQTSNAWTSQWADVNIVPAARKSVLAGDGTLQTAKVRELVRSGDATATAYLAAQQKMISDTRADFTQAQTRDHQALLASALLLVIGGGVTITMAARRARLWQGLLIVPVRQLLDSVSAVGRGQFKVEPVDTELSELLDLSDGLADMTTSLRLQQRALAARAEQATRSAERLRRVLGFAREISASLTLPYVLEAVGTSVKALAERQCRIWLLEDDASNLTLAFDTAASAETGLDQAVIPLGIGPVGRAARFGQASHLIADDASNSEHVPNGGKGSFAVPLITSGRAIGAVELVLSAPSERLDSEILEVLDAVAGHGATAIEAARLYQRTETLSLSDALTGLANRRRLDEDLALEAERAGRYGRSLAFLMIDVDHFKSINDQHGHAQGDRVLQSLATLITEHMRSVDTAYRYGGEEMAIIARETDQLGAARLGERLREAVERYFASTAADVTISIGAATMPAQALTPEELVQVADAALYQAKRAGRNRVCLATNVARSELTEVTELPTQPLHPAR